MVEEKEEVEGSRGFVNSWSMTFPLNEQERAVAGWIFITPLLAPSHFHSLISHTFPIRVQLSASYLTSFRRQAFASEPSFLLSRSHRACSTGLEKCNDVKR